MKLFAKIFEIINKNRLITTLFCLSTFFLLWQHSTGISWDFSSYVLNAKYLFSNGSYFEWARPPLAPFLFGIFSAFGWAASEYLFMIFVSALHLFSSVKLAEKLKIDRKIFYSLSLSPFFLFFGIAAGTEMLSLALLQLFIAYLDEKKSGFFLGLAFLTRYTNIIFLPVLFFRKDFKKISFSILILLLTLLPWLAFNLLSTGNAFASMADSYAMNVKFRIYLPPSFSLLDFVLATNVLLPFLVLGMAVAFKTLKKKSRVNWIIMFLFLLFVLYSYYNTPLKDVRYLFNLIIPLSYFSSLAVSKLNRKIVYFIILINILIIFLGVAYFPKYTLLEESYPYINLIKNLGSMNETCAIASNVWVPLNYFGLPSEPINNPKIIDYLIDDGYRIILSKNEIFPELLYKINFSDYSLITDTGAFFIFGNSSKCMPRQKMDKTYLQRINEMYNDIYNESFSITNFELLFTNKQP